MKKTLKEIASLISGELSGDPNIAIKTVASLEDAPDDSITFANDENAVEKLNRSKAAAAIVPSNLKKFPSKPHIKVPNIRLAMSKVLGLFDIKKAISPGVHKTAIISRTARIGSGCTIMAGVVIGDHCEIGKDTVIYPNAVLYDRTIVGNRCMIHAGAVIGVDGFGFAPADGKYEKIPQIGNVVIGDDVEIFANTCISRATMGSTLIKRGTKIDSLTHIAHNCKIGEDCAITALVAIAGSSELKDHVSIGGTSGVVDHVTIGKNTVVMARSGVTKDIPADSVVSGFPAQDHKKEMEAQASLRRLPTILKKLSELEKQIQSSSRPDLPAGRQGKSGHPSP
jgi:UDP-3-O-[3-hydroxymyristoyl] glucosamine N-acyltransferase